MRLSVLVVLLLLLPTVYAEPVAVTGGTLAQEGAETPGCYNCVIASNGVPTGVVSTSRPTLSVTSNRAATCRGNIDADAEYENMGFQFEGTETAHTYSLSYDLSQSAHIVYVRCKDAAGNVATSSYSWIFTVFTGYSSGGGGGGGGGGSSGNVATTAVTTAVTTVAGAETTVSPTGGEGELEERISDIVDRITGRLTEAIAGNVMTAAAVAVIIIVLVILFVKRKVLLSFVRERAKPKYKFEWGQQTFSNRLSAT